MKTLYVYALERLQAYRLKCDLTQGEVGKILGVNQSQYCKMELGRTMLSYRTLCELRDHGWDVDYILTGYEYPEESEFSRYLDVEDEQQKKGMLNLLLWALENIPSIPDPRYYRACKMELILLEKQIRQDLTEEKTTIMQKVRDSMNYSQKDMALVMGVDIKKYRSMEWGDTSPDSELLFTFFNRTGCRPTVLMDGEVNGKWLLYYLDSRIGEKGRKKLRELLELGAAIYRNGAAPTAEECRQLMEEQL